MHKAKQTINAKYPKLSDRAREVALETVSKALNEMMKARNKYGIGASRATGNPYEKQGKEKIPYGYTPENDIGSVNPNINSSNEGNKVKKWKVVDGQLVEEK